MRGALALACVALATGCASPPTVATPDGMPCAAAATGLQHAQPLTVDGLDRHYMLYVPSSYACDGPAMPLVIDFHGTWSGQESDNGEELYALDGLLAQADAQGFIVARPRSLFSTADGVNTYRWDENPGDLAKNVAFAHALVTHLTSLYTIDASRVYAFGFSSGTNMAAQFFADDPAVFHGFGFVGGGYFEGEQPSAVKLSTAPAPRMYAVTGYRDYLYSSLELLVALLAANHYPGDQLFQRTDDNGHELYGWHYREMFDWVDGGKRPAAGTLAPTWTAETTPASEDLIALSTDTAGGLLATGGAGGIYHRDPADGWSLVTTIDGAPALSGICVLADGAGVAVGAEQVAHTIDHGQTWTNDVSIPAFVPGYFSVPFMNAVGCSANEIVSIGYWNAANSPDAATWAETSAAVDSYASQGAQVKVSAAGTWIASGYYDYIARSSDGVTFTPTAAPVDVQWLMGIASAPGGRWWVAGEAGTILGSTDDGASFSVEASNSTEDFYAIAFTDAQRGMAVGSHGAAILTTDGGMTWTDRSTGLDASLEDVTWLDEHTVLVIGANGTAATTIVP